MSGFGVKLDTLRKIGKEKLPDGVENLRVAGRKLDQADDEQRGKAYAGDSDLFRELSDKWGTVYESVRHPLVMDRDALELATDAIMEIHDRYSKLDGQG